MVQIASAHVRRWLRTALLGAAMLVAPLHASVAQGSVVEKAVREGLEASMHGLDANARHAPFDDDALKAILAARHTTTGAVLPAMRPGAAPRPEIIVHDGRTRFTLGTLGTLSPAPLTAERPLHPPLIVDHARWDLSAKDMLSRLSDSTDSGRLRRVPLGQVIRSLPAPTPAPSPAP